MKEKYEISLLLLTTLTQSHSHFNNNEKNRIFINKLIDDEVILSFKVSRLLK